MRVSFEDITSIGAFGILYWELEQLIQRAEGNSHNRHAVTECNGHSRYTPLFSGTCAY